MSDPAPTDPTPQAVADLLSRLTWAQRERMQYIEFQLWFLGEMDRRELIERFGQALSAATRDFAMYRQLAPDNLKLNNSTKRYEVQPGFRPLFNYDVAQVLSELSQRPGTASRSENASLRAAILSETPFDLSRPELSVVAPVTRAIHRKRPVRLKYHSTTSEAGERVILPHALVSNGARWHVRAYDQKRAGFRDFVFSRMEDPVELEAEPIPREHTLEYDTQWSRIVELELVVHPGHKRPAAIARDLRLDGEGVHRVKARATLVGYLMQLWRVDCSPDHRLDGQQYPLWLRDVRTLHGVENAHLAPGYETPPRR